MEPEFNRREPMPPDEADEIADAFATLFIKNFDAKKSVGELDELKPLLSDFIETAKFLNDPEAFIAAVKAMEASPELETLLEDSSQASDWYVEKYYKENQKWVSKNYPHPALYIWRLFYECFKKLDDFPFERQLYILTGLVKDEDFIDVTSQGCLFIDGVSLVHGDFTHIYQWLVIFYASKEKIIDLENPVRRLYAASAKYWTGKELTSEEGAQESRKQISVWDFCVDCFKPQERPGFIQKSIPTETRFSDSARSPGWIQFHLVGEDPGKEPAGICRLSGTFFGRILKCYYIIARNSKKEKDKKASVIYEEVLKLEDYYFREVDKHIYCYSPCYEGSESSVPAAHKTKPTRK